MNKIGWPYIGPVIINNKRRVQTCCEAIVTSEDIDTYSWIMKSMASIEPRWSLSKIKIIFADGLITQQLITDLNIQSICILHGDFHHLFKEVWPNNANFGTVIFSKIKTELKNDFTK